MIETWKLQGQLSIAEIAKKYSLIEVYLDGDEKINWQILTRTLNIQEKVLFSHFMTDEEIPSAFL